MMHHHLSRLLKHRLLPPSVLPHVAFSTSSKRPYASRTTKSPAAAAKKKAGGDAAAPAAAAVDGAAAPAKKAGDDVAAPTAAVGDGVAAWQREKLLGELPRPSTIPFQPRVANVVRLVGTVGAPLQMQRTPDGRFSAVSVLVQDRRVDFPKFWIPIIFQDDLAQAAASHLKENDLVYVSGQLTGDVPPFKLDDGQANIQVLANLLQFVDSKASVTVIDMDEEEEGFMEVVKDEKKFEAKQFSPKYPPGTVSGYRSKADKLNELWNDVLARPQDWTDNRPLKKSGSKGAKYPDFSNKVSKEGLWLDNAPATVLGKLDNLVFGNGFDAEFGTNWTDRKSQDTSALSKQKPEGYRSKADKLNELWNDVLARPQDWTDNRPLKKSGSKGAKYPDFSNKVSKEGLWLDSAPAAVLGKLDDLVFGNGYDAGFGMNWTPRKSQDTSALSKQKLEGYRSKADKLNELWNDVLSRPQDWTDNRPLKKSGSRSEKYPDFSNKVSKEGLWLNSAPAAVLGKLDDLVFGNGYDAGTRNKPFGDDTRNEDLWKDLLNNPANWYDNRSGKPTPKYPDFKNKESGKALWITTKSPRWAIDALPPVEFKGASKGTRSQETLLS